MRCFTALGLVLAAFAPAGAQSPAPGPSASPATPPGSAAPAVPPSPAVTPTATPGSFVPSLQPAAPASPVPTPTPVYRFVYRPTPVPTPAPDPNTPQIAEIDLSDSTIFAPSDVHVRVLTSYAVTNVVAQTLGRSIPIPRAAPGLFTLDTHVPGIPFFMSYLRNQVYPIVFLAAVPDGRTATVTLPIVLR